MKPRYAVDIRRRALKDLMAIPKATQTRIVSRIDQLATAPYPHGCSKLEGEDALWRIRIGDYRVIYVVDEHTKTIDIRAIGHRQSIYNA